MKYLRSLVLCTVLTVLTAGLAIYPAEVSAAVREAVMRCLNILIPSLFAFMTAASMLAESGSAALLAKPFSLVSRYIFRMPESIFAAMLISFIAGYPVGVKLVSDMLDSEELDSHSAKLAASFCYCGGPAFYSGAIGLAVFGSRQVGVLIFLSVILADLCLAFAVCRFSELNVSPKKDRSEKCSLLVGSINSAGRSMAAVCLTVVFFSAVMALVEASGLFAEISRIFGLSNNGITIVKSFIEITSLAELNGSPYGLLPLICAACSFGGICVVIQLFSLKSKDLSLLSFIELRPLAAVLSAVFCKILQPHLIDKAVSAISVNRSLLNINNFAASICLILMIFLLNFKKTLVFSE
ncbi:MAG: nucleoside recognition protein [Ruminococcus albus]|nr:nucleoside recognition protein [Ruminococcus albus]